MSYVFRPPPHFGSLYKRRLVPFTAPEATVHELVASSTGTATVTIAGTVIWELASGTDAGYALRFYGSNTADVDRVRIPLTSGGGSSATAANVGGGNFTYELWIKCASANNTSSSPTDWRYSNVLFDRDIWSDSRGHGIGVTNDGGNLVVVFGVAGSGLTHDTLAGTSNVGDNAWHFIVVDRNASTGLIRLGVDGVWEDSGTYTTGTLAYPTSYTPSGGQDNEYIVLGQEKHDVASDDGFNGTIGYVRLSTARRYTGASFTAPTVIPEDDASTGALYLFRDGAGTTLSDYAGGNTDGALLVGGSSNGPAWVASDISWINQNATITAAAAAPVYELAASSTGTATVTIAAAAPVYELAASSTGTATVTIAAATPVYELAASSTGTATVTIAPATPVYELAASSTGTATVTIAPATPVYELAASSTGTATVTIAAATPVYELAASSTGTATVTIVAAAPVYELAASSIGTATVTINATGEELFELEASSTGTATVTIAVAAPVYELAASSTGTATVDIATAAILYLAAASSTGTATVTIAAAAPVYELAASSTGTATVDIATAAILYLAAASSTGTATVTITPADATAIARAVASGTARRMNAGAITWRSATATTKPAGAGDD